MLSECAASSGSFYPFCVFFRVLAPRLRPRCLLPLLLSLAPWCGARGDFVRGDANRDGALNIADPVRQVTSLFGAAQPLACEDAADTNDDGQLDLTDAVVSLEFLFRHGAMPAPGAQQPGPDPTCDTLGCADGPSTPAIVINEIQYNPLSYRDEFVELHNRTDFEIDVSGFEFSRGIRFTLPEGTVIPPGDYLLVVGDPASGRWRRLTSPPLGPFEGALANGGERLTLQDGDCLVECLRYRDRFPWAVGADRPARQNVNHTPSLERIDPLSPAEDHHSWRASTSLQGTPAAVNATLGTPTHPILLSEFTQPQSLTTPRQPSSSDSVEVRLRFDLPAEAIARATLRWQVFAAEVSEASELEMTLQATDTSSSEYTAMLPPAPSQSLVRYNVEIERADGQLLVLPHEGEARAFLSYFVYDFEVPSKLTILWQFPNRKTALTPSRFTYTGAVLLEPGSDEVLVFDGAVIAARFRPETNGKKLRFLKGEEYRGDRTLNILPEDSPLGGDTRTSAFREHLGFQVFRDLGGLAPRSDWFRIIDYGSRTDPHTQNVVVQQVNERFLDMNGLDSGGDLWKFDKNAPEKKTNLETGSAILDQLLDDLADDALRREALDRLDQQNVCRYSAIGVLISNWDGFHNNIYFYRDLAPAEAHGVWRVIPWDLDAVLRGGIPLTFPRDGEQTRTPLISKHYHNTEELDLEFRQMLRSFLSPGGGFTVEVMEEKINQVEQLLEEDLQLQEAYLGAPRTERRGLIKMGYEEMRGYVRNRVSGLREALGMESTDG